MIDKTTLSYRLCAGQIVVNGDGLVWVGRRADEPNSPEGQGTWWQMPQGGIEEGEDPAEAARRELWEETGITSVEQVGETPWFTYDLPDRLIGVAWKGRYRGQRMKWFVYRFTGPASEIDVLHPGGGEHEPEFTEWRWERLERLPGIVVAFKQALYRDVVAVAAPIVAALRG